MPRPGKCGPLHKPVTVLMMSSGVLRLEALNVCCVLTSRVLLSDKSKVVSASKAETCSCFFKPVTLAAGVLAGRNGNVARLFLESLWRAVVDDAASTTDVQHGGSLAELRDALSDAFSRGPTRPLYVQTLQGFAIVDRGSWVPSDALVVAATASGSLLGGALQVPQLPCSPVDRSGSLCS